MAEQKSFLMYKDQLDAALPLLDMEQRGQLLTALYEHFCKKEPKISDPMVQMAYRMMANTMDANSVKYEKVCIKRAECGRQGGIASGKVRKAKAKATEANEANALKRSKTKQNEANEADNDTDTDTDTDTDKETETDTEGQIGPDGLSLEVRQALDQEFGRERVTELIDEVNLWAINNGKDVPDLAAMMRTFAKNQKRWGTDVKRQSSTDRAFEAFKAEIEAEEKK